MTENDVMNEHLNDLPANAPPEIPGPANSLAAPVQEDKGDVLKVFPKLSER